MKYLYSFLLIFFYVFGPVIRPIGNWFDFIFITSFVIVIIQVFIKKEGLPKDSAWLLLLFLVSSYTLLAFSTVDYSISDIFKVILKPLRILITFIAGFFLAKMLQNKWALNQSQIIFLLFLVFSTHALLMVYQFINPEFKDFVYNYTFAGEFRTSFEYNFRMGGLSGGSGGAILSAVQGIGVVLPFFEWPRAKKSHRLFYLIFTPVIFLSILLSGRSGIFIVAISLFFLNLLRSKNLFLFLFRFIIVLVFIAAGLYLLVLSYAYLEPESDIYYAFSRSLDTFISLKESGQLGDSGFSQYSDFFNFPNELYLWIFGDAEHIINDQFGRTLNSDIGFIRNLWSYGAVVALLYWLPAFRMFLKPLKFKSDINIKIAVLVMIMLVLHFKESGLYVRMLWSVVSLFWGLGMLKEMPQCVTAEIVMDSSIQKIE